jgi:6-phosphogluconolactonase (cycloisomerase 2 family)
MRSKPCRLALSGMAFVCAAFLVACNDSPRLQFVTITPATQTISATTTLQFTATLVYSDGSMKPGAGLVAWSSGTTSVATIDPASGIATGTAAGTSKITATYTGISGTATLSVNQLLSIAVTPMSALIPNGATSTQQFTAMGTFKNPDGTTGNPQDITGMVTWASSMKAVATINGSGLATAVGTGVTSISAALDGVTSPSASLTVGTPATTSLVITPLTITISTGTTTLFTAMEKLSNGTIQPLQHPVTWSSGTPAVATITNGQPPFEIDTNAGVASGVTAGTSTITATETVSGFTGTATLTVQAAAARFAYVGNGSGNGGSGSISGYSVDVTGGTLTPLTGSPFPASAPQQVLIHPSGEFMYYLDFNGSVHVEDINSTSTPAGGSLSDSTQTPVPATATTAAAHVGVIDPLGRFLYVITDADSKIYGFTIAQTADKAPATNGALTAILPVSGYTDVTLSTPTWVMTDRAGKYLYVVNSNTTTGNSISEYSIDQSTGALKPLGTPSVPTGNSPLFGTTDVNGHIYVANDGTTQSVSVYSIDTSSGSTAGELTKVGSDFPVAGATFTINVLTDPTGKYLYVLDSASNTAGQVFAYTLNTSSGAIVSQIGTTGQPTGGNSTGMAIDPTGVFMAIDNNATANLSLFKVSTSTGAATPATPATVNADTAPQFVVFYTAASGQ